MKLQRIISYATLAISILTLVLVLRRPAPVAAPVAPAAAPPMRNRSRKSWTTSGSPGQAAKAASEVRMNSGEINAALAQAAGLLSAAPPAAATPSRTRHGSPNAAPSGSMEFPGPVPNIKDYQVSMDGDLVRGQFLTQIAGKDVYLTLAGHLGSKDGYATFDATEVKIGDLSVPASLVNEVLQKKLAEQRDQTQTAGQRERHQGRKRRAGVRGKVTSIGERSRMPAAKRLCPRGKNCRKTTPRHSCKAKIAALGTP